MNIASLFSQRSRVLLVNIVATFLGRAVSSLTLLVAIPLVVRSLGQQDYAVITVVLSLTTFFAFADFGLSTSLVNDLAHSDAVKDLESARRSIAEVWTLLWVAAGIAAVFGTLAYFVGVAPFFIPIARGDDLRDLWFILVVSTALGIPFAMAQRVMAALQAGLWLQFWTAAARIGVVVATVVVMVLQPTLSLFSLAFAAVPTLIAAISLVWLFGSYRRDLWPRGGSHLSFGALKRRFVSGAAYTGFIVSTYLETGLDPVINVHFFSPEAVTHYDLIQRLFGYIPSVLTIVLVPAWPALASAIAAKEYAWVRGLTLLLIIGVPAGAAVASVAIVLAFAPISYLWLGFDLHAEAPLLWAVGVFSVQQSVGSLYLYLMNALNLVRLSVVIAVMVPIIVVPLKIFAIRDWGVVAGYEVLIAWYFAKILISNYLVWSKLRQVTRGHVGSGEP